jgi:N-acyl amino acid synthase of PEP-CTERM/exosortase system
VFEATLLPFEPPGAQTSADAVPAPAHMLGRYNNTFRTLRAETPEMIRMAQAIRYQVYCLEREFESAAEHSSCLERDSFDAVAIHNLILHRPTSDAIGTARLILPRPAGGSLPIQQLLHQNGLRAEDYFPVDATAEVSRFAISNEFRRRCSEALLATDARRKRETCGVLPCLGLIQELLCQSLAMGLTHWAAVMEPKLLRMLAAMGIHFTSVGPLVSHHGLRQPSYCRLPDMLERLHRERPDHWMVVTNGGALIDERDAPPIEQRHAA